jgi:hypothetical protein
MDFIGNTSSEELQVLFGGLDNFAADPTFPVNNLSIDSGLVIDNIFPASQSYPSISNECPAPTWISPDTSFNGAFTMHQLNVAVNDLEATSPSYPHRHITEIIG